MAIFGRKKDKEEEEEFESEEGQTRKFTKKIVDLKPANKKKRKEPPKPWGKKERLTVLIILAVTAILSLFLMISATGIKNIQFSAPKFDFPSLNFLEEETIIIEKK